MADFRRCILAFVALTLLLGLVPAATAQTAAFQCVANAAVPPTLRQEGLTEEVGDIVLNCNGGTVTPPGAIIPQANITIFLGGTNVTSRLIGGGTGNSEATLLIDEPTGGLVAPAPGAAIPCTTAPTCNITAVGFTGNPTEFRDGIRANAWQGTVAGNSVSFVGIPVDPPGTQGTRIYRITNVRINANSIPAGPLGTPGQVVAFISATPATSPSTGFTSSFPINNPQQIVGFVLPSLSTSVRNGGNSATLSANGLLVQQCFGISASAPAFTLRYQELFQTAFKPQTAGPYAGLAAEPTYVNQFTPGTIYNAESAYTNRPVGAWFNTGIGAGNADFGTRLKAVFNNIPNGFSIFAALNNTPLAPPGPVGTLPNNGTVAVLTASATGPFSPVGASTGTGVPGNAFQLPIVSGSATATWEVLSSNPLTNQTFDFQVWLVATASPATNSPAIGTGTVNMGYAPTPTDLGVSIAVAGAASSSLPVPRFADQTNSANIVQVVPCRTNLLYPFVTNQVGFDTGLAISNTSTDPFGSTGPFGATQAQAGTCTLNFYGANAPAAITTASIASGTVYTTLASTTAPNFQGYVIAVCNFQYAHGFAFISDLGARNLAMGYLALIIPDPPRSATPFDCTAFTGLPPNGQCLQTGEQLGY